MEVYVKWFGNCLSSREGKTSIDGCNFCKGHSKGTTILHLFFWTWMMNQPCHHLLNFIFILTYWNQSFFHRIGQLNTLVHKLLTYIYKKTLNCGVSKLHWIKNFECYSCLVDPKCEFTRHQIIVLQAAKTSFQNMKRTSSPLSSISKITKIVGI